MMAFAIMAVFLAVLTSPLTTNAAIEPAIASPNPYPKQSIENLFVGNLWD